MGRVVARSRVPAMNPLDIPKMVATQLADGTVWQGRDLVHNHDGLLRAILDSGTQRPLYAAAVFALLPSGDLRLRTGAIGVLHEVVPDIGAGKLAALLRNGESLFRGVRPAWRISAEDLEQAAAMAIAAGVNPGDTVAIGWLRRMAKERSWGAYALNVLARVDGDWIVVNAKGLVPHNHLGVLSALRTKLRAPFIDALAPWPPEVPALLTRAFWKKVPPAEATRLRQRMWPGEAP